MSRADRIHHQLMQHLTPFTLTIEDESFRHNVPVGAESHFKVTIVSDAFDGLSRVKRHRLVNQALALEFEQGLHALSLHLFTPSEWQRQKTPVRNSPACHNRRKKE